MSDDLVKRLRDTPNWMREGFQDWKDNVRTYDRAPFEAADRIEELEAKLAKAVEALGTALSEMVDYADTHPAWSEIWEAREAARATLAELTGGKDGC